MASPLSTSNQPVKSTGWWSFLGAGKWAILNRSNSSSIWLNCCYSILTRTVFVFQFDHQFFITLWCSHRFGLYVNNTNFKNRWEFYRCCNFCIIVSFLYHSTTLCLFVHCLRGPKNEGSNPSVSFINNIQEMCVVMATFIHKLNKTLSHFSFAITIMHHDCQPLLHYSACAENVTCLSHRHSLARARTSVWRVWMNHVCHFRGVIVIHSEARGGCFSPLVSIVML